VFNNSQAFNAWQAFDCNVQTSGQFGNMAIVSFPEARQVKGFSIRFEYEWNPVQLAIEGKIHGGEWTSLFESTGGLVNYGRYGALTTPMSCTAVRILTNSSNAIQSCQFFDAMPLVPMSMSSNTGGGVSLISDPVNYNLYRCFTEQVNAYTHGTAAWYYNDGDWQSNRGGVSTRDQNRFVMDFGEPKSVEGFSVGGIANYSAGLCYANCLLIEGRESGSDFWRRLGEYPFSPSTQRTQYFDFPVEWSVGQLRITVQDVSHGSSAAANSALYLPPIQIWGM